MTNGSGIGIQMAYHLKGFDGTTPKVSMEQIEFLCLASLKDFEADQISLPSLPIYVEADQNPQSGFLEGLWAYCYIICLLLNGRTLICY